MQIRKKLAEKAKDGVLKPVQEEAPVAKKRGRWDKTADGVAAVPAKKKAVGADSPWEKEEVSSVFFMLDLFYANNFIVTAILSQVLTPATQRWDETPAYAKGSETPGATPSTRIWDATPAHATPGRETPLLSGDKGSVRRNRWDETPRTERG